MAQLKIVNVELSRASKMRATRAIQSVHDAYHEKDGIRALEAKLDEKRGSAAKHIYSLVLFAFNASKLRNVSVDMFADMCSYAEAAYKAEHHIENLKEALPTWSVFKSNILRGVRDYGLDPRDHRSEGAFRVAMQKAEIAAPKAALTSDSAVAPASQAQIDTFLASTVVHDPLRVLVSQIIFELEILKRGKVTQAVDILRGAMDALQPLVDQRKAA